MKKLMCILLILTVFTCGAFASILVSDLSMLTSFIAETFQEVSRWTEKVEQWKITYEHIQNQAKEIKQQIERWKSISITDIRSFMNFINSVDNTLKRMNQLEQQVAQASTVAVQAYNDAIKEYNLLRQSFYDGMLEIYNSHDWSNPKAKWDGSELEGIADEIVGYETFKTAWENEAKKTEVYLQQSKEVKQTIKNDIWPNGILAYQELKDKINEASSNLNSVSGDNAKSPEEREQYQAQIQALEIKRETLGNEMKKVLETYKINLSVESELNNLLDKQKIQAQNMEDLIKVQRLNQESLLNSRKNKVFL